MTDREEPRLQISDEVWREYQRMPEQGYSHRHFLNYHYSQAALDLMADVWDEAVAAANLKWLEGVHDDEDGDGVYDGFIDQHQVIRVGRMKNPYRRTADDGPRS